MNNLSLLIISGPSGIGKTYISKILISGRELYVRSVSATTRAPREGEIDGVDYFFVTKEKFADMLEKGEFLEYTCYNGAYYGTPKSFVYSALKNGKIPILVIDVRGALNVKSTYPEAISVFLKADYDIIEKRLRDRGLDSEENMLNRLQIAKEELEQSEKFDFCVENKQFEEKETVKKIDEIVLKNMLNK